MSSGAIGLLGAGVAGLALAGGVSYAASSSVMRHANDTYDRSQMFMGGGLLNVLGTVFGTVIATGAAVGVALVAPTTSARIASAAAGVGLLAGFGLAAVHSNGPII